MQRRGLSNLVSTVLIILFSLLLVTLLGIIVINELSSTPNSETVIGGISIRLNLPLTGIFVNQTSKDVTFVLERRAGAGQMDGFVVVLDNDRGTSKTYNQFENTSLNELERRTFSFRHDMQGNITYLKIIPIIHTSEGSQLLAAAAIGHPIGLDGYALGEQDVSMAERTNVNPSTEYNPLEMEGLISYLSFDASSQNGNKVVDLVNNSNYVTLQGSVQYSSGIRDQGILFDGQSGNVTFNTNQIGNFGTKDFTMMAWIKADKYRGLEMIASKGNVRPLGYTPIGGAMGIAIGEGVFYSSLSTSTNKASQLGRGAVRENIWHQAVITRVGTEHKFYLDGKLQRSEQTSEIFDVSDSSNLSIGSRYCLGCFSKRGEFFRGVIDEFLLFNRSLSQQEIENNYESLYPDQSATISCNPSQTRFLWTTYSSPSIINAVWKNTYLQPFYPDIEHQTTMSQFIVVPVNSYDNHYPYIDENGNFVNGGIPQNADLNALRQHLRDYSNITLGGWYAIPQNYDGYVYLDYELWPLVWDQLDTLNPNDGISPYIIASKNKVRTQHPSWTEQQIETQAEIEWNEASRIFITTGIEELRQLFPNAKIGIYGIPSSPIYFGYTSPEGDRLIEEDDQLGWLWNELDYIAPSIYLVSVDAGNKNYEEILNRQSVYNALRESRRIADQYNKPIIPFTNYNYYNISNFGLVVGHLTEEDYRMVYESSILFGSEGILLWGYENTPAGANELAELVSNTMGPTIQSIKSNNCPINQII